MSRFVVCYHSMCSDGFAAAWVCRSFLKQEIEFIPCQYNSELPDFTDADVLCVDFSFRGSQLEEVLDKCKSLKIIDHHKGVEEELKKVDSEKLEYIFNNEKSGATLTWEYFYNTLPPIILRYIQDRDLWTFKLHQSKLVTTAIQSYPFEFTEYDKLMKKDIEELIQEGKILTRQKDIFIQQGIERAMEVNFEGYKVLVSNSSVHQSEIAGSLAKDRPFGMCWFVRKDGKYQYSLRSTGLDVSLIARKYSGNGHVCSAGFESNKLVGEYYALPI